MKTSRSLRFNLENVKIGYVLADDPRSMASVIEWMPPHNNFELRCIKQPELKHVMLPGTALFLIAFKQDSLLSPSRSRFLVKVARRPEVSTYKTSFPKL